ncbi:hypothetical protein FALCPG4_006885 [Fusarium falciforme]
MLLVIYAVAQLDSFDSLRSNYTTTCNPHKAFSQTTGKTTRRILVLCFIMVVTGKRCSRVPPAQSRPCSLLPHPLNSTFIIPTGIGRTKKHNTPHHPSSLFIKPSSNI